MHIPTVLVCQTRQYHAFGQRKAIVESMSAKQVEQSILPSSPYYHLGVRLPRPQ